MSATARLMMTRTVLHLIGTLLALYVSVWLWAGAAMWLRMMLYGGVWLLCAGVYFGLLYLWQQALDGLDLRIRALVRDELTVDEMRRYQRRLRFLGRWQRERTVKKAQP